MVVVEGVGAGAEHGGEVVAGAHEDLAQEAGFGRLAAPVLTDNDGMAAVQHEGEDVEGVAECVLRHAARPAAADAAAGIGAGLHLDHGGAEPALGGRLHDIVDPAVDGRDHLAGEGLGPIIGDLAAGLGGDAQRIVHAAGARAVDGIGALDVAAHLHGAGGHAAALEVGAPLLAALIGVAAAGGDRQHDRGEAKPLQRPAAGALCAERNTHRQFPKIRGKSLTRRSSSPLRVNVSPRNGVKTSFMVCPAPGRFRPRGQWPSGNR